MQTSRKDSVFSDAIKRLDGAFQFAQIDEEAVLKLKHPQAVLQVSIPVRRDDGSLSVNILRR
jgi:glutamate dehydrogenase (NADP+)